MFKRLSRSDRKQQFSVLIQSSCPCIPGVSLTLILIIDFLLLFLTSLVMSSLPTVSTFTCLFLSFSSYRLIPPCTIFPVQKRFFHSTLPPQLFSFFLNSPYSSNSPDPIVFTNLYPLLLVYFLSLLWSVRPYR